MLRAIVVIAMLIAAPGTQQSTVTYEQVLRDLHEVPGQRYPKFAMRQIDWAKVGQELGPEAAKVGGDDEFGLLCMRLVARLEHSHEQLQPGTAKLPDLPLPKWDLGLACLIDDRDRPLLFYIDRNGPAEQAGVKIGMAVVSVNGEPATQALENYMKPVGRSAGNLVSVAAWPAQPH